MVTQMAGLTLRSAGGVEPYRFIWSNGGSSEDIIGLTAGTYTVTITDENDCEAVQSVVVEEPEELNLTFVQTNVSCNGDADGTYRCLP